MSQHEPYKISVGSSSHYEDLIAEITFPKKAGLIISQEKGQGDFEISLHSLSANAADDFDYSRNVEAHKIAVDDILGSIHAAIAELRRLARKE